jgi:hypothetical protein
MRTWAHHAFSHAVWNSIGADASIPTAAATRSSVRVVAFPIGAWLSTWLRSLLVFIQRDGSTLQPFLKRLTLDQLHHNAARCVGSFESVNLSDVRMIERREDLSFTLKSRETVRIFGEGIGQEFQGYVTLQLRVERAVDDAHAAFADLRRNLVWADARTCGETHLVAFGCQL